MKALCWHGTSDVRVDNVPDPKIADPTDAIIRVTSTAICGSDLHLYEVLGPFLQPGGVLGRVLPAWASNLCAAYRLLRFAP